MHALLLPYTSKWAESDHSKPLSYIVAVPYSDHASNYHLWKDVSELWQYYGQDEDGVVDIAYPKLRDRMRDAETQNQNKGDKR
ncbi:hypothetical protein GCM10007392_36080 [Saccharospirillum salsuginis]|uniref:Uncharacterized protein n=2 Tax=Saccharospirillum salsuginis TaxID=418750 RepID=A0A918KL43_9GAMM|nr:hypothetical protein GCM10007392_36080 [Saccharospirillum salsuginis]